MATVAAMHINAGRATDEDGSEWSRSPIPRVPTHGVVHCDPNTGCTGASVTAIAAMASMPVDEATGASVATVGSGPAIATVSTGAVAPSAATVTPIDSSTPVAAATRITAVPPRVTTIAAVMTISAMAAQRTRVPTVAHMIRRTGRCIEAESIPNQKTRVRFFHGAITDEHVYTGGRFILDALNAVVHAP